MVRSVMDQSKVAVSWAARLAAAQLRGDVNALAVLVRELAGEGEAPVSEALVAAVELTVAAFGVVADNAGRTTPDLCAFIALTHAENMGRNDPLATVCEAVAMASRGQRDLEASALQRLTVLHDAAGAITAVAVVLAMAWRHQGRIERIDPLVLATTVARQCR
jgi:hypothetical protein